MKTACRIDDAPFAFVGVRCACDGWLQRTCQTAACSGRVFERRRHVHLDQSSGGFVPSPFTRSEHVSGDFNRDGLFDLAIVNAIPVDGSSHFFIPVAFSTGSRSGFAMTKLPDGTPSTVLNYDQIDAASDRSNWASVSVGIGAF